VFALRPYADLLQGAGKAMAETRVYKRRRPERTDYYRIIDSRFEELERMWPECFEQKYGYLRKEVVRAIPAFLDCGIPDFLALLASHIPAPYESLTYYHGVDLYVQEPICPD
jgi:hypothetical protein